MSLSRIFVTILRAPCEPMSSGYCADYCYNPKFFGFLWSCARHLSASLMMWRKILFGSTNFNSSYFVFCCCEQIGTLNTDPNVVVPHEPCLCECECLDCSLEFAIPSFSRIVHRLSTIQPVSWALPYVRIESPCCFWNATETQDTYFVYICWPGFYIHISTPDWVLMKSWQHVGPIHEEGGG
jgi:hypothetical protein